MAITSNIIKVAGGSVLISKDGGTTYTLVNAATISSVQASPVNPAAVIFRFTRGETIRQGIAGELHFLYGNVLDEDGAQIAGSPEAVTAALQAIFFLGSGGGTADTPIALSIVAGQVDWDASAGNLATLVLTQSVTFNKPTNLAPGTYLLRIQYSGVDPFTYTITWDAAIKWPNNGVNELMMTNVNGAIDQVAFVVYAQDGDLYADWNSYYA